MTYKHYNPKSSAKRNKRTNDLIRKLLRQGEIIGTANGTLQYGKVNGKELVITTSSYGSNVKKVEEF